MSLLTNLSRYNDKLITFLENPIIKYGFLILVVLQIITIDKLNTSYLQLFNDIYFKVIYAFFIAYYACFDPVYAIALTTLMIVSIQELHSRNATYTIKPESIKSKVDKMSNMSNMSNMSDMFPTSIYDNSNYNSIVNKDELVYDLINKHSLQKQPDVNDKLVAEYNFCQEPAFETITNNLIDNNNNNENNNIIKDANQTSSIQGLEGDIYNIQGIPIGYDKNSFNKL